MDERDKGHEGPTTPDCAAPDTTPGSAPPGPATADCAAPGTTSGPAAPGAAPGFTARARRVTAETRIDVGITFPAPEGREGESDISTGVPFFDHMLTALASTARWECRISATGDVAVDAHHTVEDVGIVMGRALAQLAGDGSGLQRYGWSLVPMDDALVAVAADISGRPYAALHGDLPHRSFGGPAPFHTDLVTEWLWGLARGARWTIHAHIVAGTDAHHLVEALFKAAGLAISRALERAARGGVPSTKGVLFN